MNKRIESQDFTITCLTPVHIGSGEKLGKTEYLYDARRRQVSIIDGSKFYQLLLKKDKIDEFARALYTPKGFNLYVWLKKNNFTAEEIAAIAQRVVKVLSVETNVNEIALQARQADGRLYIPGSSIKGAIRTAVLSSLLQNNPFEQKRLWLKLEQDIVNARNAKELRRINYKWENELLSKVPVKKSVGDNKINAAASSVMRGLLVSDAITDVKEAVILKKWDRSYVNGKLDDGHSVALFRECIPKGTKFNCRITIDCEFMKLIGIENIADIWRLTRQFYHTGINWQQEVFGQQCRDEMALAKMADILLGGGTGFVSKTVFYTLALAESKPVGVRLLAKYFDKMFQMYNRKLHQKIPSHNHVTKDKIISPRTLKLVTSDQGNQMLGLCQIKE